MSNNLPALDNNVLTMLANLRASLNDSGGRGAIDGTFLRVNDKTGEMTYGQAGARPPEGMRWSVALQNFRYGYVDMQDGNLKERNVIPRAHGPKPLPAGGSTTRDLDATTKQLGPPRVLKPGEYGSFEGGGPQDVLEVTLSSIDEKGLELVFSPFGKSNKNRLEDLFEQTIAHTETPDGQAGYLCPVLTMFPNHFYSKNFRREVWHWDFKISDWLHLDGASLLSQRHKLAAAGAADDVPWDDDEELTAAERELLDKVG